jgi:hypothetical protein
MCYKKEHPHYEGICLNCRDFAKNHTRSDHNLKPLLDGKEKDDYWKKRFEKIDARSTTHVNTTPMGITSMDFCFLIFALYVVSCAQFGPRLLVFVFGEAVGQSLFLPYLVMGKLYQIVWSLFFRYI